MNTLETISSSEPDQSKTLFEILAVKTDVSQKLGEIIMATQTRTYLGPGNYDSDTDHSDY